MLPQVLWTGVGPDSIYNYNMAQATAGAMTLGSSRDDPVGHTSQLPGWTAWGQSGSITVVPDSAWPGGNYAKYQFGSVSVGSNATIGLTTDPFPVVAGAQVTLAYFRAWNVPSGVTLTPEYDFLYYTAAGTYISTSIGTQDVPGANIRTLGLGIANTNLVPTNARFARLELMGWQKTGTDPATSLSIGGADILKQWSFGNYLNDLTVSGQLNARGTAAIAGPTSNISFFGAPGSSKPTVSGSKAGNAALGSLMTALANLGLVTDTTT